MINTMGDTIVAGGRISITEDGKLHLRDVRDDDKRFAFQCKARSEVTGEVKSSPPAYLRVHGKLTITKTCPYNMVFTIFLIFCSKHRLWVHVRTASLRRF